MITIVHGGQTGVDRGAHAAALENGWRVTGYMPRDGRDEHGPVPMEVARFLVPYERPGFTARTEANVRTAAAALIIVRDVGDPRATPGTAKTLQLAAVRHMPRLIADPATDPTKIAHWIWNTLLTRGTLPLQFETAPDLPQEEALPKILVAGPRESKWPGAQRATQELLHQIAHTLTAIEAPTPSARAQEGA